MEQYSDLSEDDLRDLYINQGLSMADVAEQYRCSETSIRRRLHELLIPARRRGPQGASGSKGLDASEAELRDLYLVERLSLPQIAALYDCAVETVRQRFITLGIPIRSFSQAHLVQHGTYDEFRDFDGDLSEKSYLIGFRIGDLTARKEKHGSEVITIGGTSTKLEQIQLIQQLFARYGHVHIDRTLRLSGAGFLEYQIRCSLNASFEFLLPHPDHIPEWILAGDESFISFFAGFTDAEGSFNLQQPRDGFFAGQFSLKNTDKQILEQCRARLETLGVHCSQLSLVYRAGRSLSRGIIARKDLWEFDVRAKTALLRLIVLLSPYLRHTKRRQDMERVKANVEWRESETFKQEAKRKRVGKTRN